MRTSDQILTTRQMIAAEDALIDGGISVDELMLRAGRGAAEWVWRIAAGRPVTVLCGPGNNGGDGYVIAQVLRERAIPIRVVAPIEAKTDAARNAAAIWAGKSVSDAEGVSGGLLVDCLFGSGLSRPLTNNHAVLIARLARTHDFLIAVDLPSGTASNSGTLLCPDTFKMPDYDLTLALGAWKQAHWRMPAMERMGERRLVPIGVADQADAAKLIARPELSAPAANAHKYTRGLLVILGGEMPGAALLAAQAAMRSGAGYVKLLASHSHPDAPASLVIDESDLKGALSDERIDALLIGPGLGRSDDAADRLRLALQRGCPAVLDGDALTLLSPDLLRSHRSALIATPHEGELATLCKAFGISAPGKLEQARELAKATGATIVAKGPDTFVCDADGRTAFSGSSPSWLSVAGSGDSLAGIIASRLASGVDAFDAACDGVWLHGEAARFCGPAFTADELAKAVSRAYAACL